MTNLKDLSSEQLHRIVAIKSGIEDLEQELDSIAGDGPAVRRGRPSGKSGRPRGGPKGKWKMSAAGKAAIAAGARKP